MIPEADNLELTPSNSVRASGLLYLSEGQISHGRQAIFHIA